MSDGPAHGLSWSGYNVQAPDRASIDEVKRVVHVAAQVDEWRQELQALRAENERLRQELSDEVYENGIHITRLVEHEAEVERLREALRQAADEPNIDRARAIADEALR